MLFAVKRQWQIKCFKFLCKSCGAGLVANVGRESVPCGRSSERVRSVAELGSETWSGVTAAVSRSQTLRLGWYFVSADLTTSSRTRSSAYIGYECRKWLCSRSQCKLTGYCTVMPLSTFGSLHQSPTSHLDKDFGRPPRTICVFLLSYCLLLDVVLSLSLALVLGTPFLPMSLQHFLCSLSENV